MQRDEDLPELDGVERFPVRISRDELRGIVDDMRHCENFGGAGRREEVAALSARLEADFVAASKTPYDSGSPAAMLEQGQKDAQRFRRTFKPKAEALTALDHFAMAALTGGMSNPLNGPETSAEEIASGCYAVARAMMAERAK